MPPTAPVPAPEDYLEVLVKTGTQKMLQSAVEREVEDFLGRELHERSAVFRGHRNGDHRARQIGVGMGTIEARVPRGAIRIATQQRRPYSDCQERTFIRSCAVQI